MSSLLLLKREPSRKVKWEKKWEINLQNDGLIESFLISPIPSPMNC